VQINQSDGQTTLPVRSDFNLLPLALPGAESGLLRANERIIPMRTTDRILELDCSPTTQTLSQRLVYGFATLASVLRVFRNRMEINALHELDDKQLKDIGLSRSDLNSAFLTSTFFEDPSDQLTRSARNRGRNSLSRTHEE
jgi:uncharacterized protein YjiS (DUF1127 family)